MEEVMSLYIVLANFTEQGIRNVKDSPKRAEAFRDMAKKCGVTVKDTFWTLGQYDIVAILEAPDDVSITALGLSLGRSEMSARRRCAPFPAPTSRASWARWSRRRRLASGACTRKDAANGSASERAEISNGRVSCAGTTVWEQLQLGSCSPLV
jgi:uncharacterized protein with GYD domain